MSSSSSISSESSLGSSASSKSSSSSISSPSSLSSRSSSISSSCSTQLNSTSSQTESTSSSCSSVSSLSSSSSSEIKATQLTFDFRGTKWSASKLICSGIPAIRNTLVKNKQCQVIKIPFDKYTIKYISCFLGKFNKISMSYNLILEVYDTDEDGLPQTLLASSSLSSDVVNEPAWHNFDFGSSLNEITTPENQLIALVFYQNGGDEQNYVYWYYSIDVNYEAKCYVSKDDGLNWAEQTNVTRAIVISDIIDIFKEAYVDSDLHALTFPAGQIGKIYVRGNNYLANGDFSNTQLINDAVSITHKPYVLSIVVDSSGSMGWNDRYKDRVNAIRQLIDKLKAQYPNNIYFDIVSFGATIIDNSSLNVFDTVDSYVSKKIDLNVPDNSTQNNDGSEVSLSDGFVAWGFKNLELGHKYIISSINWLLSNSEVEDGLGVLDENTQLYMPVNYQNIGNQNNLIKYSIQAEGTGKEKETALITNKAKNAVVCDMPLTGNNIIRKPFTTFKELNTAFVMEDIAIGDTKVIVDSFESFKINSIVDVFDANHINTGFKIIEENVVGGNNVITLDKPLEFDFKNSFINGGCLLQESSINNIFYPDISDTMLDFKIKNASCSHAITFYLQSVKGGTLEWNIMPFTEWQSCLLSYAGDVVQLDFKMFNTDNEPLPDYTTIHLTVDQEQQSILKTASNETPEQLRIGIKTGEDYFYVWSNDSATSRIYTVEVGDFIILVGSENNSAVTQGYNVVAIEESEEIDPEQPNITIVKKTVTFEPVHSESWTATEIILNTKQELETLLKVDVPISGVDITPQKAGKKLSPELLEEQDPPQVEVDSSPNDFNQSKERKRDNVINIPLNNGVGRIRILPITEDVIETIENKKQNAFSFYDNTSLTEDEIIKLNILQNDFDKQISKQISDAEEESVAETITPIEYTIETPIYLIKGYATSHMTAKAKEMSPIDLSSKGVYNNFIDDDDTKLLVSKLYSDTNIMAKMHTVYPSVSVDIGGKTRSQAMGPISVYFQAPVQLALCVIGNLKSYCRLFKPDAIRSVNIPFVYAATNNSVNLHYNVSYKGSLLKQGQMRVKIFDYNRNSTDMLSPSKNEINMRQEAMRYIPKAQETEDGELTLASDETLIQQINYYHEDPNNSYLNGVTMQEATYLPGYATGGYLVDIENGRAVVNIACDETINFESHLVVIAEVISPNDERRSAIIKNTVFILSPLEIKPMFSDPRYSFISSDYFYVFPQLDCPQDDRVMLTGDGQTLSNFKAQITWAGQPVPDNTLVKFTSLANKAGTKISPGVSKTINGIASDSYGGPHSQVINTIVATLDGDISVGIKENFLITASVNGVKSNYTVQVMWMGVNSTDEDAIKVKPLYVGALMYKDGSYVSEQTDVDKTMVWADGWDYRLILIDLYVSYIGGWDVKDAAPFLLGDYKTGNENNKPVYVNFGEFGKGFFSKSKPVDPVTNQSLNLIINNTTNTPYGWAVSQPIRKAFVPKPPSSGDVAKCQDCYPYDCTRIKVEATLPSNLKTYTVLRGCWSKTSIDCRCIDPETFVPDENNWYMPKIIWLNPLDGSMSLMSDVSPYIYNQIVMDGTNRTRVDIDVSFSGQAIPIVAKKHKVVKFYKNQNASLFTQATSGVSGGTLSPATINYNNQMYEYYANQIQNSSPQTAGNLSVIKYKPKTNIAWMQYFPNVKFEVFLGWVTYKKNGEVDEIIFSRNIPAISATQNDILLSIQYTSLNIYVSNNDVEESAYNLMPKHFHECEINESGNGKTIRTFAENTYEDISSHEHPIYDFVIENTIDSNNVIHSHNLKSTATVYINPFTIESVGYLKSRKFKQAPTDEMEDPEDKIEMEQLVIKATIEYDASRTFTERTLTLVKSFDIYKSDVPYEKKWNIIAQPSQELSSRGIRSNRESIIPIGTAYTQIDTTNNYSGFNLDIELKRNDGTLPPDGTRAEIEIEVTGIESTNQNNNSSIVDNTTPTTYDLRNKDFNKYLNVKFSVKSIIEGQQVQSSTDSGRVAILTKLNWIPTVKHLLPEITNDNNDINTALNNIESIGSSQINDAIAEASSAIKKHYSEHWAEDFSYSIMVFSDGDENYSKKTFNYVSGSLSTGIDVPVNSVGIGNINIISKTLLNAYATKTNGSFVEYGANSEEEINERIMDLIKTQQTNSGNYSNVIELPDSFYIKELMPLVSLPEGSKAMISFQIGDFLNNLGITSEEFLISEGQFINMENLTNNTKNKYIKYRVGMTGNEYFQSPSFLGCLTTYVQSRTCRVFSQPIQTNANINEVISEINLTHKSTDNDLVEIKYGICLLDSVKEENYYNDYILPFRSGERYIVASRSNEKMISVDNINYAAVNGPWDETLTISVFISSLPNSLYQLINQDEYVIYATKGEISFKTPRQNNDSVVFSINFPSEFRILCHVTNHSLNKAYIDHIGLSYGLATKSTSMPVSSYIEQFESSSSDSSSSIME